MLVVAYYSRTFKVRGIEENSPTSILVLSTYRAELPFGQGIKLSIVLF
jgi:hypothetical protein